MATRKTAKGKTKPKRKKAPVTKATKRGKAARKAGTTRKKAAKKAPLRRASSKKARTTPKAAVTPAPVSPRAQREAVRATPSPPAPPAPSEERLGVVTHYYSHPSVVTMRLETGTLRLGDVIHIRGHNTDFRQKVESLEINHAPVTEVGPSDDFGVKVIEHAREHDIVFKVRS